MVISFIVPIEWSQVSIADGREVEWEGGREATSTICAPNKVEKCRFYLQHIGLFVILISGNVFLTKITMLYGKTLSSEIQN